MKPPLFIFLAISLGGCAGDFKEIGREPQMSPVGSGLAMDVQPTASTLFASAKQHKAQTLWDGNKANMFSDPRATQIGDVVTVNIAINDSATLGNATTRSLDSIINTGFDWKIGVDNTTNEFKPTVTSESLSSSNGQGNIGRSEKIQLSVAAVVTDVLPNGNLVVSGSQEVRVNYELRLLNIGGIIRPRDISRNNTISYDKVAEARISYGGRGRVMEVQQPAVLQQVYDRLKPF